MENSSRRPGRCLHLEWLHMYHNFNQCFRRLNIKSSTTSTSGNLGGDIVRRLEDASRDSWMTWALTMTNLTSQSWRLEEGVELLQLLSQKSIECEPCFVRTELNKCRDPNRQWWWSSEDVVDDNAPCALLQSWPSERARRCWNLWVLDPILGRAFFWLGRGREMRFECRWCRGVWGEVGLKMGVQRIEPRPPGTPSTNSHYRS